MAIQNPLVPPYGGSQSHLNITANTIVKATPGTLFNVNVTTAGSTVGHVYDATSSGGNTNANMVGVIPNTAGVYRFVFPCKNGISIVVGTGQVVSVSYQ